ncbi:hypothetical protein MLD38_028023 [Melastoma candidum]|uniref:Uncharacterized protein n=1 Tax=Melastoma candidum TaxID=119954 RepID=A0ACB9MZW3_9MYRT|nr:hypothetical protein MLD38_028023 [Melastoma candidum]
MDFWNKARTFAEEAAKKSSELTKEAVTRSQDLAIGSSRLSDIVSRSKELAAEATKKADQIKVEAMKRADQIKSIAIESSSGAISLTESIVGGATTAKEEKDDKDLERFGVTDELREFVQGINVTTFQDFPLPDDVEMSNVPTVSNVRQDLTEFQEKHAKLVLSSVKEISKLRYELCPRIMKERKFWRIYFILVNSHIIPYEKQYMEEKLKASEEAANKSGESQDAGEVSKMVVKDPNPSKTSAKSSSDQDLDVFLLGDLGDDDEVLDEADRGFDDDFDKMADSSDDEKEKSGLN